MPATPRHRWLRFSLKALLAFVAVASMLLAWRVKSVRDVDKAENALRQAGFEVLINNEEELTKRMKLNLDPFALEPRRSYWKRVFLGEDIKWNVIVRPEVVESRQVTPSRDSKVDDALMLSLIDELHALGRIAKLNLQGARTGSETLRAVSSLQHVSFLNISDTRIDDTGLSYVEKMQSLKSLRLGGFHFDDLDTTTREGTKHLRNALPNTEIRKWGETADGEWEPVGNATNWKAVIADYEDIIQREPNNASAIHFLARIFAAVKHFQNVERAIELATKACELTEWKKALYFETLAIAHSENGDFATAVKWMEKAVSLDPENEIYKVRLEGFKTGKPFREHPIIPPTEEADAP